MTKTIEQEPKKSKPHSRVEQSEARQTHNLEVAGSSPAPATYDGR